MRRFDDEGLTGAEFRECDLSRARLVGVVMPPLRTLATPPTFLKFPADAITNFGPGGPKL